MNNELMFSSASEEWSTPQDLFDRLNRKWRFTLDPCATHTNHKCEKYYTKEENGLVQPWNGHTVFCNPPYGRGVGEWIEKATRSSRDAIVVMLLPARTDTKWFQQLIKPNAISIMFLSGRLKFGGCANAAPFPSMIVIF